MRQAIWYFDFISPYAYLGLPQLERCATALQIRPRPVLFAGLLKHWGQKGPAEIATKRTYTYRWCTWYAAQQGIDFRFPAAHPFNPLPYLRLAIAAEYDPRAIAQIFRKLWTSGADPADPQVLQELLSALQIERSRLDEPAVKDALRAHTGEAIGCGVFGVPTFVIDNEIFWGADSTDFVLAYVANPAILQTPEMQRASTLPVGVARI